MLTFGLRFCEITDVTLECVLHRAVLSLCSAVGNIYS